MPDSFPDTLTAFFATNRSYRGGDFGNDFYDGDPRLYRFGQAALSRGDAGWQLDGIDVYPERKQAAPEGDRVDKRWTLLGSDAGFSDIRAAGVEERATDVLVYLHGAGNSFASAAETTGRMAELYSDPAHPVLPFFFSYPANGQADPLNYLADRDDATLSGIAMARAFARLVEFLAKRKIADGCGQRVHLLAHSLGNFALRKAVETMRANANFRRLRLFDTVFLAHADDDEDTLANADKMMGLTRLTDDIVVYYDHTDKLLRLSDALHMDRLGQKGPNPFPGAEVNGCRLHAVDCSSARFDIDPDRRRHNHYLGSRDVVEDIRAMIRGRAPAGRVRVEGREGHYRLGVPGV